jgi:hypothetical protein
MRVGIAFYADKNNNFINLAKNIEKGIIEQSHQAEIIDLKKSNTTLTGFEFIIFGVNSISLFGGKLPSGFLNRIASMGTISGKHCACFVDKKIGAFKTLQNFMKLLEKEGCLISSSEILSSPAFAYHYSKKITIY